jgi:hypothetical protein
LRGVGVSQEAASSIKSTTAEIYGGNADIDLFSALNNFTGQVSVYSTGDQVSVQDTNQLSMNALTGNLDPTTSIKLWAGTGLVLTPEDITTTSGNIEFRSLDGNLSTPGNLTTTTGNIALHASTTAATGNVQVNNLITTGSGNVTVEAEKEVNLSKSIVSTSGDIAVSGATVTHSTGSSGDPLTLETGADGTITVVASGTGGFVMGQYYGYQSDTGTISITSGGTADLANITTNGTLTVDAVGLVQQVGSGSVLDADSLRVTTANNGAITLTNAGNDLNKVKLQSRNPANNDIGSGVIAFHDVDGFAVSEISTTDHDADRNHPFHRRRRRRRHQHRDWRQHHPDCRCRSDADRRHRLRQARPFRRRQLHAEQRQSRHADQPGQHFRFRCRWRDQFQQPVGADNRYRQSGRHHQSWRQRHDSGAVDRLDRFNHRYPQQPGQHRRRRGHLDHHRRGCCRQSDDG